MKTFRTIKSLRNFLNPHRLKKKPIGFVPTMGALHHGHLSLIKNSQKQNDITVLSIFVNPIQFGPKEDLKKYPRPLRRDLALAKSQGVDAVFIPTVDEMYPNNFLTYVEVSDITNTLCGLSRPGHFRGVTTVVGKLINIVSPDRMYLGQKDAQQAAVIQKMVLDLNFPTNVIVVPTVREADGLALSSRNIYLSSQERKEAPILYRSLTSAKAMIQKHKVSPQKIETWIRSNITKNSSAAIEYVSCVDANTLKPIKRFNGRILIAIAVRLGHTRLIDNIVLQCK